jgi:N-acylneuraminate cytidylyltransferase
LNIDPALIHAIIPARAGSKAIKNKNIIPVLGKPLIAWSVELATTSKLIDEVFVSTDSSKIQSVAEEYGALAPYKRPQEISGDTSLDIEFIKYHIEWLNKNDFSIPNVIVHLRPTGPARCLSDLNHAITIIQKNPKLTGLKSISLAKNTPYKMWTEDQDIIEPLLTLDGLNEHEESHYLPRQRLPKVYWQNGYIDIIKTKTVINENSMVGSNCYGLITSQSVSDLDYLSDLPEIENYLTKILNNKVHTMLASESDEHSV